MVSGRSNGGIFFTHMLYVTKVSQFGRKWMLSDQLPYVHCWSLAHTLHPLSPGDCFPGPQGHHQGQLHAASGCKLPGQVRQDGDLHSHVPSHGTKAGREVKH